jgi:predicted TIM-barrel fold metal-dependent hydrolase
MLKVQQTLLERAKYPVVDVHTHFRFKLRGGSGQLAEYLEVMDRNNIAVNVTLDGKLGDEWSQQADLLWPDHQEKFIIFVHIDWQGGAADEDHANWACNQSDFVHRTVLQLKAAHANGAEGLKLFKSFGLTGRNGDGSRMTMDDPRWNPIWKTCGELGMAVLVHTADPAAFFQPVDAHNERYEELFRHPDWSFAGDEFPNRQELLEARNRVIRRHPQTTFIGAHLANNPEDLAEVAGWLQQLPNLYVEIASRIGELGRQPYTSRKFFIDHADRILFGTDGPWPEARLRLYWRFLETNDEYFPYSEKEFPPQGFWQIYGIGLPDDVLRKVYYENAARILPGARSRLIAAHPELSLP